jgi:hypothetical protein
LRQLPANIRNSAPEYHTKKQACAANRGTAAQARPNQRRRPMNLLTLALLIVLAYWVIGILYVVTRSDWF